MALQYDLFEKVTPEFEMKAKMGAIQLELTNVRRGMFARLHDLSKLYVELESKFADLETKIAVVPGDSK
jgi:hypothetical protein